MKITFPFLAILVLGLGCASKPAIWKMPVPSASTAVERSGSISAADIEPKRLRGCQWTWAGLPREVVTFEVWSSTNLVDWVLATNTPAQVALFPEKEMEFYKVRSRDELGQVSDWARVPQ